MTTSLVGQRTPVAIDDGLIRAGTQTAAFDRAQPETLLRNYLRLIRRARSQQRAPEISLRREDVEALADYLGVTSETVLHRLATLMGSSRTQRNTMLAAFASGALLVGLAGSVSATSPLPDNSASIPIEAAAPAVVAEDVLADGASADGVSADLAGAPGESEAASAVVVPTSAPADTPTARQSTVVTGPTGADRTPSPVPQPRETVSTATAAPTQGNGGPTTDRPPAGGGTGVPDGAVELVSPVVPDLTDNVAVGDAVVPASTGDATDEAVDDGNDVIVPPVTPTTIAPIDDVPQELPPVDDDTVAVGPPPVPTTVPTTTTTPPTTTPTTTAPVTTTTTTTTTTPTTTTTTVPPATTVPPTTVATTTVPPTTVPPTTVPAETVP